MSTATKQRDRVKQLANTDINEAYSTALEIDDPWFKSQALSFVARKTEDKAKKDKILNQSFYAALETDSPNRKVSVSSYPISVASEFKNEKFLESEIDKLLSIIEQEPHPVRKLDALLSLIHSLHRGPVKILNIVVDKYIELSKTCKSWKKDRGLYQIALLFKKHDSAISKRFIELIWDKRKRKKASVDINDDKLIKFFENAIDMRYK